MTAFEHALVLLLFTTVLSIFAGRLPWPYPITYVLGGAALNLVPYIPAPPLRPDFFFVCFLPPLLFSDGWLMPLRDLMKFRRSVLLLAIGLVIFTTVVVGVLAHTLFPDIPLAMGFALGAVISPTDAVAVSAITERLKVPARLTIILEGESLLNDATGLVAFKFALAALIAGSFSPGQAVVEFLGVALGGSAIGLAVGYIVGRLRDLLRRTHTNDPLVEITASLLTPFAAYIAADSVHASGVLSVVLAGLYSGWRDPVKMDAETRQSAWAVWSMLLFWLNGVAFVLLGQQFPRLIATVAGHLTTMQLLVFPGVIAAVVIVARLAWFFPGAYLPFLLSKRIREREEMPSWRAVLVGGWAGLRGAVTLAAALSIPLTLPNGSPFPARDLVIFLACVVIMVTLLLQGTTTEWLIRRLGLQEDGIQQKEELLARTAAVTAGLKCLRAFEKPDRTPEEEAALGHVVAEYEQRISALVAEGETRARARHRRVAEKRYRFAALEAERRTVNSLWREEKIGDEVHRLLQEVLDHEERLLHAQPKEET
jgi:CPA1 family monovalent cation:H+ antiporter